LSSRGHGGEADGNRAEALFMQSSRAALRAKIVLWQEKCEKRIGKYGWALRRTKGRFSPQPAGTRRFWPIAVSLVAGGRSVHGAPRSWHWAKIVGVVAVTTM